MHAFPPFFVLVWGQTYVALHTLYSPLQRFWFILPEESIKELMGDPEFVKALQAGKVACVGNYWGSEEYARLNKAVGGVLCSWQHGVLEIGFDFAEPYNFAKHSTGMMFMR